MQLQLAGASAQQDQQSSAISPTRFRFWYFRYTHPAAFNIVAAISLLILSFALAVCISSLTPHTAYAGIFPSADDVWNGIKDLGAKMIDDFWGSIIKAEFDEGQRWLKTIGIGQMTNNFDNIFKDSGAWGIVTTIHESAIMPISYSVLAIVFLVQTVKIANRIDGNQAVPGLKEIIFLLFFFVIGKYVIDNSLAFCQAIYDMVVQIIQLIDKNGSYASIDMSTMLEGDDSLAGKLQYGSNGVAGAFIGLLFLGVCLGGSILAYVMVFARGLQIYLYTIVAPIPLAMLFTDETKQQAMGFIKNFLAVCFAGLIMVIVCKMFPMMMQSVLQTQEEGQGWLAQSLAVLLVFIFALVKSGTWARDIFGG